MKKLLILLFITLTLLIQGCSCSEKTETTWHENGQIMMVEEKYCKDGKEYGKSTQWYENGQKWYEWNYRHGKFHGKQTMWHSNGQKSLETNYKSNKSKVIAVMMGAKLDGKQTWWYENGQIMSEVIYKDGKCISGDCVF